MEAVGVGHGQRMLGTYEMLGTFPFAVSQRKVSANTVSGLL